MLKHIKGFFKIEYILLFLISFELLDKHHFMIFLLFAYLFIRGKVYNSVLNKDFMWLLIWGVMYFVFAFNDQWSILQIPSLLCAFAIGYTMTNDKESFFRLLLIMGLGYAIEGMLTVYMSGGLINIAEDESTRTLPSLWGENMRALSAQNVIFYLYSAVLVYLIQRKDLNIVWKIIAIIFEFGVLYNAMRIAARSSIIFCPIIIAVSLTAMNGVRIRAKALLTLVVVILTFILLYQANIFGIQDTFENSFLLERFVEEADGGIGNNSRFDLHRRFFDTWQLAFWGGLHDINRYWFHNTWLDMYAYSGILGFIAFIVITIRAIMNSVFVYKRVSREEKSFLIGTLFAFYLPFWMDPILWAAPCYFALFVIFYGALSKRKVVLRREGYVSGPISRPSVQQMPIKS